MVIKMDTIDGAHAANAINYVLDKEKARKEDKPVFLASNHIELNPMTGKPYSPVEVLMDMQLLQAASRHKAEKPFWRIELCPPPEVCQDWTMEQWNKFCKDCVQVLDATDHADLIDQPLLDRIARQHGTHIIDHAERIGLGSRSYTLIDLADLTGIQLISSQAMPQSYNIFRIDGTPVGTNKS